MILTLTKEREKIDTEERYNDFFHLVAQNLALLAISQSHAQN